MAFVFLLCFARFGCVFVMLYFCYVLLCFAMFSYVLLSFATCWPLDSHIGHDGDPGGLSERGNPGERRDPGDGLQNMNL